MCVYASVRQVSLRIAHTCHPHDAPSPQVLFVVTPHTDMRILPSCAFTMRMQGVLYNASVCHSIVMMLGEAKVTARHTEGKL